MRIYGSYEAPASCMIDFFEFEFPRVPEEFVPEDLENGDLILSVDWDESDWNYDPETGTGSFRMKGIYINQRYANGYLDLFKTAILDKVQIIGAESEDFVLTELLFEDGDKSYMLPEETLFPREIEYVE